MEGAASDRLNFFAQVGQREKRSFMLRRADVTVHKVQPFLYNND
jgi:hypothetical protein